MEKILLKNETQQAQNAIAAIKKGYADGMNLLGKLSDLGLELTEVKNWQKDVEPFFKKHFPEASIDFNLEASGLKNQYYEAEKLFKTSYNLFFVEPTAEELEAVTEKYKVYAESEKQIEAYNLINGIVADLKRLKDFGVHINASYLPNLSPLMTSIDGVPAVSNERLANFIQSMK